MLDEIFDQEISNILRPENSVPVCEGTLSLKDALLQMQNSRSGCIVILSDHKAVGIFTERDFLQKVKLESPGAETPITEYMVHKPVTVRADITIKEALVFMKVGNFRSLIVNQQNGTFQGVVTMKDLMYYITDVAGFQNE